MTHRPIPKPARRGAVASGAMRNLVLVNTPGFQDIGDFQVIKAHVEATAPDVAVTIVDNEFPLPGIERQLAQRPTIVVSPIRLRRFNPLRGRVFFGRPLDKQTETRLLVESRLPTPPSVVLQPGTVLDPNTFGDYVILKPLDVQQQSHGQGVQLTRRGRVRYRAPEEYPEGHPGRETPIIVQRFIDTGEYPHHYRVLTLFGEALYSIRHQLLDARPALDAADDALEHANVATNGGRRTRSLAADPDITALAKRVDRAFPGIPLKGIDVLRDTTGKLWVIEINGGGNT